MKKYPLILLFLAVVLTACNADKKAEYTHNSGRVFGTYYNITYLHPEGKDLHSAIQEAFQQFDLSLSTFNPNSIISQINRNEKEVVVDDFFLKMYEEAQEVSLNSEGAFDITVAPLVNAWGFGTSKGEKREQPDVEAILSYVGYQKISIKNNQLIKNDERILLDASAIAKGQSADVIAQLLDEHACLHYMVEVGGEIVCKGQNPKGKHWVIGIDKPTDEFFAESRELQTKLSITNCGLATSGNYRQFYYQDGKKFSHTIDPRTGYPVSHNLLSATVIAPNCMKADAYATAFMVLGVEKSLEVCKNHPELACYLIYTKEDGSYELAFSEGFEKFFTD